MEAVIENQERTINYEYEILKYLKSYKRRHGRNKTKGLISDIFKLKPIKGLPSYLKKVDYNTLSLELAMLNALKTVNCSGKGYDTLDILFSGPKPKKIKAKKEIKVKEINKVKEVKAKKEKQSILSKVTFIKKPIVKAILLGAIILTGISSTKKDAKEDIVANNVISSSVSVKNLGIYLSNISPKQQYKLNQCGPKEWKKQRVITISKGIEKEHTEAEYQEEQKRNKLINYYARVYNLNEKKVRKIVKKTTKLLSYKSFNKKIDHDKLEFTILNTVKGINESIYTYQKEYGSLRENNYKKTKTYREMVRHYARLYGIDANKALAIEFLESGYYKQPIASVKHNPGSKRKRDGSYYTYANMEQGIIEHMITLCHYKGQSIEGMAARYCSVEGAAGWAGQVRPIYNNLQKNPDYYTLLDEKGKQKSKVR